MYTDFYPVEYYYFMSGVYMCLKKVQVDYNTVQLTSPPPARRALPRCSVLN